MKKILTYVAMFCFGMVLMLPSAHAASCAKPRSLQEYRKNADIVVSGTATIVVDKDAFISVDDYYKGHGPQTIRVTGRASEAGDSSLDYPLEEGKKYLLFLTIISGSDQLRTSQCVGNTVLEKSGVSVEDRVALGKSKITMTPTPSEAFHNTYKVSPVSFVVMILSGLAIFSLLLVSVLKDRKALAKKTKGKKKTKK